MSDSTTQEQSPVPAGPAPAISGEIRQAAGAPVPAAAVTLTDLTGRQVGAARADDAGNYRLPVPTGGTYLLIVSAPGHRPSASLVAVADRPVHHSVVLSGGGGLTGTVRLAGAAEGLAGAVVTVTDLRGEVVGTTTTRADGVFSFAGLGEGEYTLVVTAAGHHPVALPVTVNPGGQTRQDVELAGSGRLAGVVRRAVDGRPLAGAGVTLLDAAGQAVASAATGDDGGFCFTDLLPGEYTLVARGYAPSAAPLHIDGEGCVRADLVLGEPTA